LPQTEKRAATVKFFQRKKPKIEVFVRYCYYSDASARKERFPGFSHAKCFHNLMETADLDKVHFTFLLDTHFQKKAPHFVYDQKEHPVVEIDAGCESKAFLALLDHVLERDLSPETPLYFLEDDYLHRPNWAEILFEGFSLEAEYLTLFDHRDKYDAEMYKELSSKLYYTPSCHWRETPSTTNTYAMRMKTLLRDLQTHRAFSEGCTISKDHEKFLELKRQGAHLISSIPGWSTHAEPPFASPCYDWTSVMQH
jgi:hypothetical protein